MPLPPTSPESEPAPESATRSFIRVVIATCHPSPSGPTRIESGMRASWKNTSLNSASPVSCTSGRTSTPGACMSTTKYVRPRCFGTSGLRAREQHPPPRQVRERRPHLLAVHHPLVAVAHRARRQPGDVGARARLGEQLAPDLFVRGDAAQQLVLLLLGPPLDERRAAHADADEVERARHLVVREHVVHGLGLARREREPGAVLGRPGGRGVPGLTEARAPLGVVEP